MTESKLIVPESGLPLIHGWASLSEVKKRWLQEKTTNIKIAGSAEALASVKQCLELMEVKNGLKDETMSITDYINGVFSFHPRTGWRKLEAAEEMAENWPPELIKAVAEKGARLLHGVAGVYMKDMIRVSKMLPPPKKMDEHTIEAFIEKDVREALKDERSTRAKKKRRLSREDGEKIIFNHDKRILESIKGLETSADRREVIKTVVGWLMEWFAVSGMIECKRLSIPDGTVFKVGRPLKKSREKAA